MFDKTAVIMVVNVIKRFHQSSTVRILGLMAFFHLVLLLSPIAHSACRDPEVARGFTSLAYAANVDATIQYFGHNFFLITTSKGTRIVTDPLGPGWYPNPNVIGDVVTVGKE